jgi:SAM-dependent methyltransferase
MGLLDISHGGYVHRRRVDVLSREFASLIPAGSTVLDVGSGDGWLAARIRERVGALAIHGIDTLVRPDAHIPIAPFDGRVIPHPDASFDYVMFVDVLHHTDDPLILLREAARVARNGVLIKDHLLEGALAGPTLRFMDWVGNARHGVTLPYNYWPRPRWHAAFRELKLVPGFWKSDLGLYPGPADWAFGRSLHFIARLDPAGAASLVQVDAPEQC